MSFHQYPQKTKLKRVLSIGWVANSGLSATAFWLRHGENMYLSKMFLILSLLVLVLLQNNLFWNLLFSYSAVGPELDCRIWTLEFKISFKSTTMKVLLYSEMRSFKDPLNELPSSSTELSIQFRRMEGPNCTPQLHAKWFSPETANKPIKSERLKRMKVVSFGNLI